MTRTALIVVQREDPWSEDARILLDELSAMVSLHAGCSGQSRFFLEEVCSARSAFVVARDMHGDAVGCGAFRRFDFGIAELKRIYSRPLNAGVGRAILTQLELGASAAGYHTLLVETSLASRAAKAFFWRAGFEPSISYTAYGARQHDVFLEKALA